MYCQIGRWWRGERKVFMEKNDFKIKGSLLAGIIQILACIIVYKFNIPNPNIVLFVLLSAAIVQFGYFAGIISGVIAVLYSAFFFLQITAGFFTHRLIVTSL